MKVSLSWLKDLVKYDLTPQELADKLSLKSIGVKQITDDFIELDLTYNRGDLLSLRGAAREVAAITDSKLSFEDQPFPEFNLPQTPVIVENPNLCPVYAVAKIESLKVENSSETWVKKLNDSGIRSVNNIADITNLVMLEYGQPLHAFDAKKVTGSVGVRVAKKDEKITTLDAKVRHLTADDLLITDERGPIGIAGVMGGKGSEVSENTNAILLEAAIFNPIAIRSTSKRLGLYSEAAKRFQHGLTKTNLLQAMSAAIKMYESIGGKVTAITLTGDLEDKTKTIKLTQEKVNSLIGIDITPEQIEDSLKRLGFSLASHIVSGNVEWDVTAPYFRLDINIEEDLVEEVARMYGYEKIVGKPLQGEEPQKLDESLQNSIHSLKTTCKDTGLTEVQTYSFYSSKVIFNCQFSIVNLIKIANPISSETEYLRDNLWPNLLEIAAKNLKKGFKDIAIFEIGKVYSLEAGQPKETYHLAIALVNATDNPIQELYQLSQSLGLHLEGGRLNPREYFHPIRYTDGIAEIHPRIVNKFGIEQRVAVLEMEI